MNARPILVALLLCTGGDAHAQAVKPAAAEDDESARRPRYSVYEAGAHVGELAAVRGMVREVLRSPKGLAVLTFGGCYPDQVFSVVIADPRDFGNLKRFNGSTIEVAGFVRRFGGKPEIVISRHNQILRMEPASDPTQGGMGGP
jgi:hypothetical protein